ncbi:MAG TPA: hypothetical protein VGX23_10730 [Actinocrinis sp.]|nr:hypothetical protein [Actinocrinis sp.]
MTDYRLVARVDVAGVTWPDELIAVLTAETGLEWKRELAQEQETNRSAPAKQGGTEQLILGAVAGAIGEMAVKAVLEQARETIELLGKRWLNRPPHGTVVAEVIDPDTPDDLAALGEDREPEV